MNLKKIVVQYLEGEKKTKGVGAFLFFLSKLYQLGISIRNFLYDIHLLPVHHLSKPVISVGSIVAGGTGKTPLILYVANELSKTRKVAILTRGYLSKLEKSSSSVCLRKIENITPSLVGDEPFLLYTHLPHVDIWVGKNRASSAKQAIAEGADIILLEDGMQHRCIHRDVEVVVLDGRDLWGGGYYLPRGYLRDAPSRLKKVDLVVLSHTDDFQRYDQAVEELRSFTQAPIMATSYLVRENLPYKKVGIFCGIGKPKRFIETVQKIKVGIVDTLFCVDHAYPTRQTLELFAKTCQDKGAECLLCTEKDFVKLPQDLSLCIPVVCVPIEVECTIGKSHLENIIKQLKQVSP